MMQTVGENTSNSDSFDIRTSVLAPQEEHSTLSDDIPLLATTSLTSQQLFGAEQVPGKSNRHTETLTAATRDNISEFLFRTRTPASFEQYICSPNIRTGKRYIYFLRRMII
ncbi:MAG: hypothetical protein RRY33_05810 [Alistipes sp.]